MLFTPCALARNENPPLFALHAADGTTAVGSLLTIEKDWSIHLGGDGPSFGAGSDVITLRRQGQLLPQLPTGEQVVLSNGDRLLLQPGKALRLTGERLECQPLLPLRAPGHSRLSLPVAAVAAVWFAAPDGTEDPRLFLRRLLAARRAKDVVLLRNGDMVEGTVLGFARERGQDDVCRLDVEKKSVAVALARVAAIAFSADLLARSRPRGAYGHVVLRDGGRLALASAQVDPKQQTLTGKMVLGPILEVPLDHIAALDIRQGRATYLSELEPRTYQHTPFFSSAWPLTTDGSVTGRELRLGGNTYDKGLGLHAKSEVSYDLGGKYEWFEAVVGIDDLAGSQGRAAVRVLVDGKACDLGFETISAAGGPVPVRVRIRGARSLTLAVDFGPQGDVQAHVDWADARLIK